MAEQVIPKTARSVDQLCDIILGEKPAGIVFVPTVDPGDEAQDIQRLRNTFATANSLQKVRLTLEGREMLRQLLPVILKLPFLQELEVNKCNFSSEACEDIVDSIKSSRTLRRLSFRYTNLDAKVFSLLVDSLSENSSVTSLDLYQTEIGSVKANMNALSDLLLVNSSLTELLLDYCLIDGKNLKSFCAALSKTKSLKVLSFNENNIGNSGHKLLYEALKSNTSLEKLYLTYTAPSTNSLKYMGNMLVQNKSLKHLYLNYNGITIEGFVIIVDALLENESLLELVMMGNKLKRDAWASVCRLLEGNISLLTLRFDDNPCSIKPSSKEAKPLLEALNDNPTLTTFSFSGDERLVKDVDNILKRNLKTKQAVFSSVLSNSETKVPWNKCKLLVVGEGRSGKTALVRSLLGKSLLPVSASTEGADLHRITVDLNKDDQMHWQKAEEMDNGASNYSKIVASSIARETLFNVNMKMSSAFKAREKKNVDVVAKPPERITDDRPQVTYFGEPLERESSKTMPPEASKPKNSMTRRIFNTEGHDTPSKIIKFGKDDETATHVKHEFSMKEKNERRKLKKTETPSSKKQNNIQNVFARSFDEKMLVKSDHHQKIEFTLWDYGGQEVFFSLHHLFLSGFGVFIVAFDLCKFATVFNSLKQQTQSTMKRKGLKSRLTSTVNSVKSMASGPLSRTLSRTDLNDTSAQIEDMETFKSQVETIEQAECVKHLVFWLRSIHMFCPNNNVFLVGTFLDKIKGNKTLNNVNSLLNFIFLHYEVDNLRFGFRNFGAKQLSFLPLTNKTKDGVMQLREAIKSTAIENLSDSQLNVPLKAMYCLDDLMNFKDENKCINESVVSLKTFKSICKKHLIANDEEIETMLSLFNDRGLIVWLKNNEHMRSLIVRSPQWLLDCISTLIRDEEEHFGHDTFIGSIGDSVKTAGLSDDLDSWRRSGVLSYDLAMFLLKNNPVLHIADLKEANFVLSVMQQALLLTKLSSDDRQNAFLIPAMLPRAASHRSTKQNEDKMIVCSFEFNKNAGNEARTINFLPDGMFEKIICFFLQLSSEQFELTEHVLSKKKCEAKVKFDNETKVAIALSLEDKDRFNLSIPWENDEDVLSEKASKVFNLIHSILIKLKEDFFRKLYWKVQFLHSSHFKNFSEQYDTLMDINAAKETQIFPWTREGRQEASKFPDFDIEGFLQDT